MSASRLLSVLVAVVLVVTGIFVARAGIATSAVTSALDQSDRHPGFVNPSLASAAQAYMAYRRGEWNPGNSASSASSAALDQSDRHPIDSAALAEQAYMAYRRGEWNAGNGTAAAAYDIELEQARQHWPAAK